MTQVRSLMKFFAAARNLELECKQTSQSSAAIHKSFVSHQVGAASNTPSTSESFVLDKIFHRLSNMENRLTKIEKSKSSNPNQQHMKSHQFPKSAVGAGSKSSDELFCTRCKRSTHLVESCHAKKDRFGKILKN